MIRQDPLLKLIDIVRDVNKTISMLIDNPQSKPVAEACIRVCIAVSDDLGSLEREIKGEVNND